MTGREKLEAAFSPEGAREFAAVICYEGIYIRDHWDLLTSCPWWYQTMPDITRQLAWRRDTIERTGQDWFHIETFYSREERRRISYEPRGSEVFRVDRLRGTEEELERPRVGGWSSSGKAQSIHPEKPPGSMKDIDRLIPPPGEFDEKSFLEAGHGDLASAMLGHFGQTHAPFGYVSGPVWNCYSFWGFEGLMLMIADRPDLVKYASEKILQHRLLSVRQQVAVGARVFWIEDCLTDMMSPDAFRTLNVPVLRRIVEEIRSLGARSVYYYCGGPEGKLDDILAIGADAVSFEETKKSFVIDIEEIVAAVNGRCAVLGNLDAIVLLEQAPESALRAEIARQIAAGRKNRSRFIMSIGSPVTPATTVGRVRLYCDIAHELGAR